MYKLLLIKNIELCDMLSFIPNFIFFVIILINIIRIFNNQIQTVEYNITYNITYNI